MVIAITGAASYAADLGVRTLDVLSRDIAVQRCGAASQCCPHCLDVLKRCDHVLDQVPVIRGSQPDRLINRPFRCRRAIR